MEKGTRKWIDCPNAPSLWHRQGWIYILHIIALNEVGERTTMYITINNNQLDELSNRPCHQIIGIKTQRLLNMWRQLHTAQLTKSQNKTTIKYIFLSKPFTIFSFVPVLPYKAGKSWFVCNWCYYTGSWLYLRVENILRGSHDVL